MAEKKPTDPLLFVSENGALRRTVTTTPLQVGYPGNPSELMVTGKVSHSLQVVSLKPGQSHSMDDSVTILCVKISSGTGTVTVVLPGAPRTGQVCHIKDASGSAASNNIVVSGGRATIDGSTTRTLTNAYESTVVTWTGDSWAVIGGYEVGPQGPQGPAGVSGAAVEDVIVAGGYGASNSLAYSLDGGLTWTGVGNSVLKKCWDVAWNGTTWLAVGEGSNTVAWSVDGINWTGAGNPFETTYNGSCRCVAWSGENWVIGGTNSAGSIALVAKSPQYPSVAQLTSGWSVRHAGGARQIPANYTMILGMTRVDSTAGQLAAVGTKVLSVGYSRILVSSDDGLTWDENVDPNSNALFVTGSFIASSIGNIVAGGLGTTSPIVFGSSAGLVASSHNGAFNIPTTINFGTNVINSAAWNGSYWLASGQKGNFGAVGVSADGAANWVSSGASGAISKFSSGNDVCWTGKRWVAVGRSTSGGGIAAYTDVSSGDSGWVEAKTAADIFANGEILCVAARRTIPV